MQSPGSNQEYTSRFGALAAAILDADHFLAPERPVFVVRSPGRLDVMGGNVDYTGGMVLQSLLREAVWVASQARADETVRVFNPGAARFGWNTYFELDLARPTDTNGLRQMCGDESTFWGRYVLGAVYFLQNLLSAERRRVDRCPRTGLDLFISSDLPPNKGVIREHTSAIPRWTEARWHGYLSNLAPAEFRTRYERWLPEILSGSEYIARYGEHVDPFTTIDLRADYPVRAAVRYATEENLRVQIVKKLLEGAARTRSESDVRLMGELFSQSHHAYAECGLGSHACDNLVERARNAGIPGAKMTGGGGGGVVALLGCAEDHAKIRAIAEAYAVDCGTMPHVFEGSSDGADAFGVCILQPAQTWSLR